MSVDMMNAADVVDDVAAAEVVATVGLLLQLLLLP